LEAVWYDVSVACGRFLEPMSRITTFLSEVRVEMGKVSWPTREQLLRYTGIVLAICLFFAVFLGGIDTLLTWVVGLVVG
jgi:preprotein translocase subunit SecE